MATGIVKWFSDEKGFGFIEQEDGPDIFCHFKEIICEGSFQSLDEGDEVFFDIEKGEKGLKAINVKTI